MSTETDMIPCKVVSTTAKAYLLEDQDGKQSYFPRSEVRMERWNRKTDEALAEIPTWLLEERDWG